MNKGPMMKRRISISPTAWLLPFLILLASSCTRSTDPAADKSAPATSAIKVQTNQGSSIALTTSTAEFQVSPSGAVQAFLLKNGARLTLDVPSPDANYLSQA